MIVLGDRGSDTHLLEHVNAVSRRARSCFLRFGARWPKGAENAHERPSPVSHAARYFFVTAGGGATPLNMSTT